MAERGLDSTPKTLWLFAWFPSLLSFLLNKRIRSRSVPSGIELVRFEKQLKDFVGGVFELFWQRQSMFFGAVLLAAYFYSWRIAVICFVLCQFSELLDYIISKRVLKWNGKDGHKALRFHYLLLLSSTLSATFVALFAFLTARFEGPTTHLTPLFFLFGAGLFAAVNNHQLPKVLLVRLVIYGGVFLYIPLIDLWTVKPPMDSVLWLQLATSVFVLYFVVDCSIIFLRLYRKGLDQIDELRLERDRAQAAYEVKSQFVAVVSHELRTPLTSIMGGLELLKSGALDDTPERAAHVLDIAHKNSERLSLLINDLLDLQKLESGQMSYKFSAVNIAELIRDAVDSISSFAETVNVSISSEPIDGNVFVRGDHDRLLQVLTNLLSNAVKFSNVGGDVEIKVEPLGSMARIAVTDHGVGIPENSREKVFGKFSQVDSSDHRSFNGTGLGLNITEQIMDAHNGIVDYNSTLGQGATFFVELPLNPADTTGEQIVGV